MLKDFPIMSQRSNATQIDSESSNRAQRQAHCVSEIDSRKFFDENWIEWKSLLYDDGWLIVWIIPDAGKVCIQSVTEHFLCTYRVPAHIGTVMVIMLLATDH